MINFFLLIKVPATSQLQSTLFFFFGKNYTGFPSRFVGPRDLFLSNLYISPAPSFPTSLVFFFLTGIHIIIMISDRGRGREGGVCYMNGII